MRAVKRSESFEDLVQRLAVDEHPLSKKSIFPTIRELICFAAVLGFENDSRKALVGATNEVDSRIWANSQQATDLVYLVALASARDGEILREENEDSMVQIFEEFAQGGFEIIRTWLNEMPGDVNGDEAILVAIQKRGLLDSIPTREEAIGEVEF